MFLQLLFWFRNEQQEEKVEVVENEVPKIVEPLPVENNTKRRTTRRTTTRLLRESQNGIQI